MFSGFLLLSGCVTNNVKPVQYYVLSADSSTRQLPSVSSKNAPTVVIKSLSLPPYLDRKQIVTRQGDHQLVFSDVHRWGGKLKQNLSGILALNLSRALASDNVAVAPLGLPMKPDFLVQIEIFQFEKNARDRVILSAQWRLTNARTMELIDSGIEEMMSETLKSPGDYQAIVIAMSKLFAEFSSLIADSISSN